MGNPNISFDLEKTQTRHRVSFDLTPREWELARRLAEACPQKRFRGGVSAIAKAALLDAIKLALEKKIISDEGLP